MERNFDSNFILNDVYDNGDGTFRLRRFDSNFIFNAIYDPDLPGLRVKAIVGMNSTDLGDMPDTLYPGYFLQVNSTGTAYELKRNVNSALVSAGIYTSPTLNQFTEGQISVVGGTYFFFSDNDFKLPLIEINNIDTWELQLVNNTTNYVVARYINGIFDIVNLTDRESITQSNVIPLFTIYREDDVYHPLMWDSFAKGLANKLTDRLVRTERFVKETDGLILSEAATRIIRVSSGVVWYGAANILLNDFSSEGDECDLYYHNNGNWDKDNMTQYNNTQYDDGTDLVTLNPNKYAVNYIFRFVEDAKHVAVVLGSNDYKYDDALNAPIPELPNVIATQCYYVGKILVMYLVNTAAAIVQAGNSTGLSVPGADGSSGSSGTSGSSGSSGINGSSGTSGINGSSGSSGTSGISGSSGLSGTSGTSGTSGISGSSGSSGTRGSSGSSGTSGISGSSGTSGVNGSSGTSGVNGSSGTSGISGSSGSSGTRGSSGSSGTSGISGSSGSSGSSGTSGSSGSAGTSGLLPLIGNDTEVVFRDDSTATDYNTDSKLIWDNTNKRLGIGGIAPTYRVDIRGTVAADAIRSAIGFDIYPVPNPPVYTLATVSAGGSVDTGAHYYYITYYTAIGETTIGGGMPGSVQITTTAGNNTVTVTLPVSADSRVIGRKLYRTKVGGGATSEYLLATIANNVDTTYIDTAADSTLTGSTGLASARSNTTSKYLSVAGTPVTMFDTNTTYFGLNVLQNTTSGGYNTAFGSSCLPSITTGNNNVGVGYSVMLNGNGSGNVAIGPYALRSGVANNNGSNIAIGVYALFDMIANNEANVAVGYMSGRGARGNYGIYLGYYNGFQTAARNVGQYNISIGNQTGRVLGSGAGNILMGNLVELADPTISNQLTIGNVLYGLGLKTGSVPSNTGKIGVNTSTPNANLDVLGNARIGDSTANYTEFESDGTIRFIGNATVYDDIQYNVSNGKVAAVNAPNWSSWNGLSEYSFAIDDYIDLGSQELKHNWKEGSALELHVHWTTGTGNYINGDKVNWQIEYTWANMATSQPFTSFPAPTAVSAEQAFTTTVSPYAHVYTSIASFTPTGGKIGAQLKLRLKRIAKTAGGTDPGTNPFALQVGLHYEIDTIGSRTTSSK